MQKINNRKLYHLYNSKGGDFMGIINDNLRVQIWDLHNQGYFDWQIAKELNIPEFVVVKVLKKR
jgi:hypothetical protein